MNGCERVAVAALVLLAGCSAPIASDAQPLGDRLGRENGVAHDEDIDVTVADGLNSAEREAVISRTMARVELIRGLEFRRHVSMTIINRSQFRNRSAGVRPPATNETVHRWNDQVWEALFLVGENRSFHEIYGTVLNESVGGYYSSERGELVLVSDAETPTVNRAILAHELVHALQDQHLSLGTDARTQDRQLAVTALVEGDANHVMDRYEERCGTEWRCLPQPERPGPTAAGRRLPAGVVLTVLHPYASGPRFVTALRQRGGWSPVNDAYEEFPASTEQIIHPAAYPSEAPESVSVPDRSRAGWSRYDLHPRADTVGEASIYAMLWANGQLPETSPLSYDAAPSAGWAGDAVYPYRDGDRNGYVWRTRWDTREDALDFFAAYLTVLAAHNATREGSAFVVSPPDPFADAFRVTQSGRTVTVVNGPDVDSLAEIHPRGTDESAPGTRANHPLPIEPSPPVIGTETDPATAG